VTNPDSPAGDYYYGSRDRDRVFSRGQWGLFRVHSPKDSLVGAKAEGNVRVYLDAPAAVKIKEGHRFYSRRGVAYAAEATEILAAVIAKNQARRVPGAAVYFDLRIVAEEEGDQANLPLEALFGTDPQGVFEPGGGTPARIVQVVSVTTHHRWPHTLAEAAQPAASRRGWSRWASTRRWLPPAGARAGPEGGRGFPHRRPRGAPPARSDETGGDGDGAAPAGVRPTHADAGQGRGIDP